MWYRFFPVLLLFAPLGVVYGVTAVALAHLQQQPLVEEYSVSLSPAEPRVVRLVIVPREETPTQEVVSTEESEPVVEIMPRDESESVGEEVNPITTTPHDVVRTVPFYSQFSHISAPSWQKVGCGIASVAMIIDYYTDVVIEVDTLLNRGIKAGAYISEVGWSHAGLITLAQAYDLDGESVSLSGLSMEEAFKKFTKELVEGPLMVSVHYTFEPMNPIPHLVVITGVANGLVYYNDPAEAVGGGSLSIEKFQRAWKKRYISIRPVE